ncbi:MAG: hypothetical protein WAV40_02585, partial [Microgenomates group bacterium]
LILTKNALYQLSYVGIPDYCVSGCISLVILTRSASLVLRTGIPDYFVSGYISQVPSGLDV